MKIDSIENIIDLCDKYEDETINLRRKIHENPELFHREYEKSKLVENYLLKLNIKVERVEKNRRCLSWT